MKAVIPPVDDDFSSSLSPDSSSLAESEKLSESTSFSILIYKIKIERDALYVICNFLFRAVAMRCKIWGLPAHLEDLNEV